MSNRSQYLDTVLKLNRLTQDSKVEWEHQPARVSEGRAGTSQYVTEQKGKRFVLYQKPDGESALYGFQEVGELLSGKGPRVSVLEIRDASDETLFVFPRMSAIDDLYETVYTGRSNEVDAFLDEFLEE